MAGNYTIAASHGQVSTFKTPFAANDNQFGQQIQGKLTSGNPKSCLQDLAQDG